MYTRLWLPFGEVWIFFFSWVYFYVRESKDTYIFLRISTASPLRIPPARMLLSFESHWIDWRVTLKWPLIGYGSSGWVVPVDLRVYTWCTTQTVRQICWYLFMSVLIKALNTRVGRLKANYKNRFLCSLHLKSSSLSTRTQLNHLWSTQVGLRAGKPDCTNYFMKYYTQGDLSSRSMCISSPNY